MTDVQSKTISATTNESSETKTKDADDTTNHGNGDPSTNGPLDVNDAIITDNVKEVSEFELLDISGTNVQFSSAIPENQIKITHTFLENFNDSTLKDVLPTKYHDKRFLLLDVQTPISNPLYENVAWIFSIDKSGSMNWTCKDGKTKMDHLKQTFENMLGYFIEISAKFGIKQTITILTFNDETTVICKDVPITSDFVNDFKSNIKENFNPSGGTDIHKVLSFVNKHIQSHPIVNNPTKDNNSLMIHVFMSDGEATTGITKSSTIAENIVNEASVYNSFIGFGEDHDSELMKELAENSWSDYFYVKDFEQASSVYAETIYNGLYQYIKNVKITTDDTTTFIYNFDKKIWGVSLEFHGVTSGATRNFHLTVAKYNPEINITVEYELSGKKYKISSKNKNENTGKIDLEAYKYLWRQETLELLHDIETYAKNPYKCVKPVFPDRAAALPASKWNYNNIQRSPSEPLSGNIHGYTFPYPFKLPPLSDIVSYFDDDDDDDERNATGLNQSVMNAKNKIESPKVVEPKIEESNVAEPEVLPKDDSVVSENETEEIDDNDEKISGCVKNVSRKSRCCFGIFNYDYSEKDEESEEVEEKDETDVHEKDDKTETTEKDTAAGDSEAKEPESKEPEVELTDIEKLNRRIDNYFKEINTFIEKYDLSQDDFMKQLLATISSSKKSLSEENAKTLTDIHSRSLTLARQRSHSISNDDDSPSIRSTSCFRNATLDDIILRVSSDSSQVQTHK